MKKLLTAVSALAMVATMAVPAFAASSTVKEGNYTLTKTVVSVNGKTAYTPYVFAAKDPNSGVMTTFVPIWYIMQVLKNAGASVSWNGAKEVLAIKGGSGGMSQINDKHGNASILWYGMQAELGVPRFAVKDPNSGKLTTFFGLYYAEQMLNALKLNNTWNGKTHTWLISSIPLNPNGIGSITVPGGDGQVVKPGTEVSKPGNSPITGFNQ